MAYPSQRNIAHWFHQNLLDHGERPALFVAGHHYSYTQLHQKISQMASAIERFDLHPANPTVALFTYRSLTAYAALLAILYAGKGYVPLNPNFPIDRNLHILDLAEVEMLIVDSHCEPQAEALLTKVQKNLTVLLPDHTTEPAWTGNLSRHRFLLQADITTPLPTLQAPKPTDENTIAYLLFTSGTTGVPKGVMVSVKNVNAFVTGMLARYQPTPLDRFSQHSDMTFDASVYDQFVCWGAGACLYSIPQNLRMAPAQFIKEHDLTFWESVPAVIQFMQRMYLLQPNAFPSLRWCVFGGEQLTTAAASRWQKAAPNARIDNSYGPTEGTICITGYIWHPSLSESACLNGTIPIGTPYPGQSVAIFANEQLIKPSDGTKGELCLSGTQITLGYWKNQAETNRCFLEIPDASGQPIRWYKTGDLVVWKEGVGLYYLDRVDRQLKIRGYRVELTEIEHVLRQASQSDQVAVMGWPTHEGNTTHVIGFVCGSKQTNEQILEGCAKRLPYYMVPRHLQRLPQLPLNANGKTDFSKLMEMIQNDEKQSGMVDKQGDKTV